jgi:hypothetical protein
MLPITNMATVRNSKVKSENFNVVSICTGGNYGCHKLFLELLVSP